MTRLVLAWYHGAVGPSLLGLVLLLVPGEVRAELRSADGTPVAQCCAVLRTASGQRTAPVAIAPLPIRTEALAARRATPPDLGPTPVGWLRHWRCIALLR